METSERAVIIVLLTAVVGLILLTLAWCWWQLWSKRSHPHASSGTGRRDTSSLKHPSESKRSPRRQTASKKQPRLTGSVGAVVGDGTAASQNVWVFNVNNAVGQGVQGGSIAQQVNAANQQGGGLSYAANSSALNSQYPYTWYDEANGGEYYNCFNVAMLPNPYGVVTRSMDLFQLSDANGPVTYEDNSVFSPVNMFVMDFVNDVSQTWQNTDPRFRPEMLVIVDNNMLRDASLVSYLYGCHLTPNLQNANVAEAGVLKGMSTTLGCWSVPIADLIAAQQQQSSTSPCQCSSIGLSMWNMAFFAYCGQGGAPPAAGELPTATLPDLSVYLVSSYAATQFQLNGLDSQTLAQRTTAMFGATDVPLIEGLRNGQPVDNPYALFLKYTFNADHFTQRGIYSSTTMSIAANAMDTYPFLTGCKDEVSALTLFIGLQQDTWCVDGQYYCRPFSFGAWLSVFAATLCECWWSMAPSE